MRPGRVLFDPNTASADATVALSEFTPSEQGELVAYSLSDGGTDWQVWHFRRVRDGADLGDTLRFTKYWGVSWAHDGSGVYYSRYPALPSGRGDDAGRPAVYFHKLGTQQDSDTLVYEVTNHPTHVPSAAVSEDGHYLVVTLHEGSLANAVEILDLHKPGSAAVPLFTAWDARYDFIGAHGSELYFRTTKGAPRGRVLAVSAAAPGIPRTVVPEGTAAIQDASYVGGRIIANYVEDAHGVARIYEPRRQPCRHGAAAGLGRHRRLRG